MKFSEHALSIWHWILYFINEIIFHYFYILIFFSYQSLLCSVSVWEFIEIHYYFSQMLHEYLNKRCFLSGYSTWHMFVPAPWKNTSIPCGFTYRGMFTTDVYLSHHYSFCIFCLIEIQPYEVLHINVFE
jgi:hypothetical protein